MRKSFRKQIKDYLRVSFLQTRGSLHLTQEQMAALTRDVAQMREELRQAGRKHEISVSPPNLRSALSVLIWLALLLLGAMVGMVLLQTIWSGLAALWNVIRILVP